jgi:CheY-like chemotaxis protein/nitrogen-specific signal transduction histidine kinase
MDGKGRIDRRGRQGRTLERLAVRRRLRLATAERRAAQAEAAARGRSAALAALSHEMREPLNGVVGMARLLRETRLDPEQRCYAEAVCESAETLLGLINDLLDLAKLDTGKLGLVEVTFSLPHLIASLRRMLEPRATAKGLGFTVAMAPGLPEFVKGDPGRLRQVIVNLAGNALKFTERGELGLDVAVERRGAGEIELVIAVSDTGIGMPAELQARLGAPFTQATPEITRLYGGSGLGLTISRGLLEAMRGSLSCTSEQGVGTRFEARCRLGLVNPTREGAEPLAARLSGHALLIVDGQERTAGMLRDLAVLWGMDARVARNGREAILLGSEAADRSRPFDVIVIDGSLPRRGAHDLARRIKGDARLGHARLVLQAPAGMRGDAAAAKAVGFSAYLPKPVDADIFRACLQHLVAAEGDAFVTVHGLVEARRPLRILVVDDNAVNRRLAAIMLERAGHGVTLAESGAEAVARIGAEPFDAVLMDVQMPEMDGLEATRRIRALAGAAAARVPIVAVTANAMRGDDERCIEAGMDGYVTKPIDGASLVATVERLAATRRTA